MIADMHVHSTFSPDGISTMEEQCIAALEKGERIICFTDHVDYNVAEKNNGIIKDNSKANFIIEEYLIEIDRLRKKYPELKILKGIEFSEPHLFKKEFERYSQYPFDYILGSVHHCYEGVFPGAANIPIPFQKCNAVNKEDHSSTHYSEQLLQRSRTIHHASGLAKLPGCAVQAPLP